MRQLWMVLFSVLLSGKLLSQDTYFANVNQALTDLNPSFAGSNGGFRNQVSHRLSDGPQRFQNFRKSADLKLHSLNAGLAFSINHFRIENIFRGTDYSITYAQQLPLYGGTHTVVPSVNIGVRTNRINDPVFGFLTTRSDNYVNLNAGFLFNFTREFNFGVYWFHINQPGENTLSGQTLSRYLFHTSYSVRLTEKELVQVFYRFDMQANEMKSQLMVNFLLSRYIIVNMGIDNKATVVGGLGYKAGVFEVLVGYDATLRDYGYMFSDNGRRNGYWEIHLGLLIANKTRRQNIQAFENM